jgi:SAM-dependent methyltransferase
MEDVSTLVARLYEGHPYPPPATDLAEAIAQGGFQVGDPRLWSPMLWPEGAPKRPLKILVAGAGSMQAAWFAYTNRESQVFGVDLSEASLAHERFLQDKHQLQNLHLFKGDLRHVAEIDGDFDLVICTGVLHHMSNPDEGMRALAGVMAPHAALACMLYAQTGRTGVYMLQDAFKRFGLQSSSEDIAFVRRTLAALPSWHFARYYVQAASELQHDAAIADTFLHPQDRAYTVPQLLALVEDNGLHFQCWFENSVYFPETKPWFPAELAARVRALPEREQWAAVEMLSPGNFTHYFFARKNKPPLLTFSEPGWRQLAPHHHPGTRQIGPNLFRRMGNVFELNPAELAQYELADGARTLAQIADAQPGDARALFERLWKQGHVMIAMPQASSSTSQYK